MILERLRAATDDADHLAEAMAFFNAWIFAWIEAIERQLTDVYMGEREQWVRGAAAVRAAEVRALLGGARGRRRRGQPAARLRARPLPRRLRRLERGGGRAAGRRRARCSRDGAGRRPRSPSRSARRAAADRRRGPPPRLLGGAARAPATSSDLRLPTSARGAAALGRGRDAGARGRGLRPQPPRGAAGAPGRPAARRRRRGGAAPPTPTWRWRRCWSTTPSAARRFAARELGPLAGRDDATVRLASTLGDLPRGGRQLRPRRPPPRRPHQHRHLPRPPRRGAARPPGDRAPARAAASPCAWRAWSPPTP